MWHAALVIKSRADGVDESLLKLLESCLRDRHLKVTVDSRDSRPQHITEDVPQKSCRGSLLWNIYINDLLHLIPSSGACADDLTLSL